MQYLHQDKTEKIIQAYFKVYNTLGYGFLERVYENALLIELRRMGFECKSQYPIQVFYESFVVGDYFADINLTYSDIAREYLLREGLPADRIIKTGSPMFEVLNHYLPAIKSSDVLERLGF